ncbi:MAG: RNA polymerase subunit sigma-70 [Burkholderiaceae bacterium]|nr:RNA polymerase subunit sigma-70 [Burkholderiaceae bacterium]
MAGHAAAAAEQAARASYGRLLSWLAWQWRDIAAAEDALAEAFASALARWPVDGVPSSPEAWLLTTAKRNLLMQARHDKLSQDPALAILFPGEGDAAPEPEAFPDHRLKLLFICAHPAIDPAIHSALMLQTVLGLDANRIASAYLVKPETMTKRLVRAKSKIKATAIRFEEPEPAEWPERLASVLEAIYGAYTLHWGQLDQDGANDLAGEALYLALLAAQAMPDEAEALGLAALLAYCEARRPARLDAAGRFVPLDMQDARRWDGALLREALRLLGRAAALGRHGPYQLEAAIQSAQMHGVIAGAMPWDDIASLYARLLEFYPTLGARIGHAVAVGLGRGGALQGLALLEEMRDESLSTHQPWWAAKARLTALAGRREEAVVAYERTLALTAETALRQWLQAQLAEVLAD